MSRLLQLLCSTLVSGVRGWAVPGGKIQCENSRNKPHNAVERSMSMIRQPDWCQPWAATRYAFPDLRPEAVIRVAQATQPPVAMRRAMALSLLPGAPLAATPLAMHRRCFPPLGPAP
ncbi:hypothetical protein VTN96DRAFT_9618 [Rasamsonia emersonii]